MAPKSLSELNQAFMADWETQKQKETARPVEQLEFEPIEIVKFKPIEALDFRPYGAAKIKAFEPAPAEAAQPKTIEPPAIAAASDAAALASDAAGGAALPAAEQQEQPERDDRDEHQADSLQPEAKSRRRKWETMKKSARVFSIISNIIFYVAVVLVLLTVLTSGSDSGAPKTIFGYSYFTVMSGSMQSELPKGSFILVKKVDTTTLNIDDTITYMRDSATSVTHKIIDIYENYDNTGARGFQTKGVNNANPDSVIVYSSNVVGKVVFSIPALGAIMLYLAENVYIVFIIFGLCVVISFCLRGVFVRPSKKKLQHS